jgi:gliding motility-associated-like protein
MYNYFKFSYLKHIIASILQQMKHSKPAMSSIYCRKLLLLASFFLAINFANAQCPTPFAKGDIDSTQRNVPVTTWVTRNDITYNGSGVPLTHDSLSINTPPTHGRVVVTSDSTIQYIPNAGYVGNDYYTYMVCNSCGQCALASVSIVVRPYCPRPVAVPDHYTVYNNAISALYVTNNDINVASGPLTVTVLHGPRHGGVTAAGDSVVYNDNHGGYVGLDTFSYMVCDTCPAGRNCDTALVYLNVNTCRAVKAVKDTFSLQQQATATRDLAANDSNSAGYGSASVTLLSSPKYGGTVSLTGSVVTYTAGASGFGVDTIWYKICTDCGCDTGYAIFTVSQKPCSKPTATDDNLFAGYSPSCTTTFSILRNDILPINGGTSTVHILSHSPSFGTASLNLAGQLIYTCNDSTRVGQQDTITYSLCNGCFCDTAMAIVTITGYPCNGLPPVAQNDTIHVCRNYNAYINVVGNDYSPQNSPLFLDSIPGNSQHGIVYRVSKTSVYYTPNHNFMGTDHFVYEVCDTNTSPRLCSFATATIIVDTCSSAPIVLNAAGHETDTVHVSVIENGTANYYFNYEQSDSPYVYISSVGPCGDTITTALSSRTLGTSPYITITPPTNSRTQQSVEVIICNAYSSCDTVIVIIDIIPVNHPPMALNDSLHSTWGCCDTVNVLNNDSDIDPGDVLTVTNYDAVTSHHGKVTSSSNGVLNYVPDSNFAGIDTIHYTVCDTSNACASAIVVVYVPVMARNDVATIGQDSATHINVRANDASTNNSSLSTCSQPVHGTVVLDTLGGFTYTPNHDYPINPLNPDTTIGVGMDSFCYTLCSVLNGDTTCSSAMVYVSITPKKAFNIPQGISPNGDGVNDKFVISSVSEFPKSQLLVYNRYGDEVWRNDGDGYLNDFDGTWKKNGEPLPDGSYWYIFKFNDGVNADRMGYIVIQR